MILLEPENLIIKNSLEKFLETNFESDLDVKFCDFSQSRFYLRSKGSEKKLKLSVSMAAIENLVENQLLKECFEEECKKRSLKYYKKDNLTIELEMNFDQINESTRKIILLLYVICYMLLYVITCYYYYYHHIIV
jgi:hypothetical protein